MVIFLKYLIKEYDILLLTLIVSLNCSLENILASYMTWKLESDPLM